MPDELAYLLEFFYDIKTSVPISYQEIESWSRLTLTKLTPFEVAAIKMLDITFSIETNNG